MDHLELRLQGVPDREYAERLVREQVEKLERHHEGSITSCHVAVERPNAHPRSGARWRTRIEVRLAGSDPIVVRREQGDGEIHEELSKIIHDAFHAAERVTREHIRKQRGDVKAHPAQQVQGVVEELHPDYGLIFTTDGRKIYFHEHSVLDFPFDALRIGMGVAFEEEPGDEGPQASTLRVVDARAGRARPGELDELAG